MHGWRRDLQNGMGQHLFSGDDALPLGAMFSPRTIFCIDSQHLLERSNVIEPPALPLVSARGSGFLARAVEFFQTVSNTARF